MNDPYIYPDYATDGCWNKDVRVHFTVTVPAIWQESMKLLMTKACSIAGIRNEENCSLELIFEPEAGINLFH